MPNYYTRNQTDKSVLARIRRQGVSHQTTFLLSRYGTWEKAEAAAARWVKVKLKELPPPTPVKDRKTQRNTSGVVGVRLANATRSKNGRVYEDWRWVAFWPGCPKSGGIGWSVKKYGDKHAFVCAYIARKSESVKRESIDVEVERMRGTAPYKQVLKLKKLSPP